MIARLRIFVLLWLAIPLAAHAHALDEYLQATLVTISENEIRFSINLTPGVAVAEQLIKLMDHNHDGVISTNEEMAYVESLRRDLAAQLDGRTLELKTEAHLFPETGDLRTGWGIIQVEFSAKIDSLAGGAHRLSFDNRHRPVASVYLFNAIRPQSDRISITAQKRNETQSHGEIEFNHIVPEHMSRWVIWGPLTVMLGLMIISRVWRASILRPISQDLRQAR